MLLRESFKQIRKATRRKFEAEEKIRIVLERIRAQVSISELCYQERIVKARSDHCKIVEFPMKTCWKEDAQVVDSESQEEMVIESVRTFYDFLKALLLQSLWNHNFFKFRDKGLSGCRLVVRYFS